MIVNAKNCLYFSFVRDRVPHTRLFFFSHIIRLIFLIHFLCKIYENYVEFRNVCVFCFIHLLHLVVMNLWSFLVFTDEKAFCGTGFIQTILFTICNRTPISRSPYLGHQFRNFIHISSSFASTVYGKKKENTERRVDIVVFYWFEAVNYGAVLWVGFAIE